MRWHLAPILLLFSFVIFPVGAYAGLPNARQVVLALASSGARPSVVYTAASDPNHLLGRPTGYLSKAAFTDKRIKASDAEDSSMGSVDLGGGVEVFSSAARARGRGQYIQMLDSGLPLLGSEYDYAAGPVLLRLSGLFTLGETTGYVRALAAFTRTRPREIIYNP